VGHLQLKFPEVDPTRMCDLLKVVELDVDTAHAVLKATLEKETTGITQVCRHYLAGDCRRADCMVRLIYLCIFRLISTNTLHILHIVCP
jgi:hypothetical protein